MTRFPAFNQRLWRLGTVLFIPPYDARPGTPVIAQFLIRTDGLVDMSTIAVTGTSDPTFRASVARAVAGVRFHVPELRGCPVPGRGGIGERFG